MLNFTKPTHFVSVAMLLIFLTACSTASSNTNNSASDAPASIETGVSEKQEDPRDNPPQLEVGDYEGYMNFISKIPKFEPCYKTSYDGGRNTPLEKIKAMYNELKTTFNYILVHENCSLEYMGNYKGDTSFVDRYEEYETAKAADKNADVRSPINVPWYDWEDNDIITTKLKTISLGENVSKRFDKNIAEGRNFQASDFTLTSQEDPISIVLGSAYKGIYKIGDVLQFRLITKLMNFKVVGFYEPGLNFSMEVGAMHKVNFDHAIVIPHFMFDYEPVGENAIYQHALFTGEATAGYMALDEPVSTLTKEGSHAKFVAKVEAIAKKHGLAGLYKYPTWPVGFVW